MNNIRIMLIAAGLLTVHSASSIADPVCPDLGNRIKVRVEARVKYDNDKRLNTYSYRLINSRESLQAVEDFFIEYASPISNITEPSGWMDGKVWNKSIKSWHAIAVAHPNRVTGDASIPPSIVQIKPGHHLDGFSFQSPNPPGPVQYRALGYVPLPVQSDPDPAQAEMKAENLAASCPDLEKLAIDIAATGATIGPVDFVPLKIEISPVRDGHGANDRDQDEGERHEKRKHDVIDPHQTQTLEVAIAGTRTFDPRQIDIATLRLGPGQAAPVPGEDVIKHGDTWDVIVRFPVPALGLRCQDSALFMSGRTTSGAVVKGADEVVLAGCVL